jgi:P pilus assembly chaperone PapD
MNTSRRIICGCTIGIAAAVLGAANSAGAGPVTLAINPTQLVLVGAADGKFTVRNPTGNPVTLQASVGNFTIRPNGHVVVNPRRAPQHSAKRWLAISPKEFTIKPHTNAGLSVHSHPAANASPGDHYALVLFTTAPSGTGKVLVRTRLGVAVLVRVPGKIKRRLVIGGLSASRTKHELRLVIKNRGNINERLLKRHVSVTLKRRGRLVQKLSAPARDLLPRGRAVYRLPYRQSLSGSVTAVVTVRPLNGAQAGAFAPPQKPRTRKFRVRL